MSRFSQLHEANRRTESDNRPPPKRESASDAVNAAMRGVASGDSVKNVLIPELRKRIEQLDEEESDHIGTPKQFEVRGRRLEAKDELKRWLNWSGQAKAPDEGE